MLSTEGGLVEFSKIWAFFVFFGMRLSLEMRFYYTSVTIKIDEWTYFLEKSNKDLQQLHTGTLHTVSK